MLAAFAVAAPSVALAQPSPTYQDLNVTNSLTVAGLPVTGVPKGTYADGSRALSSTASDVFAANAARVRIRLLDTDYTTALGGAGIAIWCRWGTAAAAAAAPHGVGSFPLFPGGGVDDQGSGVNQSAVNCVAESGAPLLFAEQY
jgi:hypothetical protein